MNDRGESSSMDMLNDHNLLRKEIRYYIVLFQKCILYDSISQPNMSL